MSSNWIKNSEGKLLNLEHAYLLEIEKDIEDVFFLRAKFENDLYYIIEYFKSEEEAQHYLDIIMRVGEFTGF